MRASKKKDDPKSKSSTALKVVGGVGTFVSLLLALNQLTGLVQTFRIHRKDFSDMMRAGQVQKSRGDYAAAFESFKRASELDPVDREAQNEQAGAAMLLLEHTYILPEGRKFSDMINPLLSVLDKARVHSAGPNAADLSAHVGWANFLRSRDFRSRGGPMPEGVQVEPNYEEALRIDPGNPYAHAMWGHWILWEYGPLEQATAHFSAALQSERARPFVRHLQLYSLYNSDCTDCSRELFRVADEMRKKREPIDSVDRGRAFDESIEFNLDNYNKLARALSVVSEADAEATYDWLVQGYTQYAEDEWFRPQRREFIVAFLAEIAGNRSEAMSRYHSLRTQAHWPITDYVNEAIRRLSSVK